MIFSAAGAGTSIASQSMRNHDGSTRYRRAKWVPEDYEVWVFGSAPDSNALPWKSQPGRLQFPPLPSPRGMPLGSVARLYALTHLCNPSRPSYGPSYAGDFTGCMASLVVGLRIAEFPGCFRSKDCSLIHNSCFYRQQAAQRRMLRLLLPGNRPAVLPCRFSQTVLAPKPAIHQVGKQRWPARCRRGERRSPRRAHQ